jgi:hypothetical protein
VRFLVSRGDLTPPSHIGLTDEEEEMKVFLIRKFSRPEASGLNK